MPPAIQRKKVNYKPIDSVLEDERDEDERRLTKRPRTSVEGHSFAISRKQPWNSSAKAASRSRGGKLGNLMLMPVDVFAEICQYLHPIDLRALSLTSQSLRKILMSRDAKYIWKSSLMQIPDLPGYPPDLNEPQYVRLLFSSECYDCGAHPGLSDYYHRVLYCYNCAYTHMVNQALNDDDNMVSMPADIANLFASTHVRNCCCASGWRYLMWHKSTFGAALSEYNRLLRSAPELREKFISGAKEAHSMRNQTGMAILVWKQAQERAKQMALERLKDEYEKSIEAELLLLGWQEGDFPKHLNEYTSLVRKPKKLTKGVWQTLLPKLEPLLESGRQTRLARESMERRTPSPSGWDWILDTDSSPVFGAGSAPDLTEADFDRYFLSNIEDDMTAAAAGGSGS